MLTRVSQFLGKRVLGRTSSVSASSWSADYKAVNEPILDYRRDSDERNALNRTLDSFLSASKKKTSDNNDALFDIPIVIGDREIRTELVKYQRVPFQHNIKLVRFYHADESLLAEAIDNSVSARAQWEATSVSERAGVLLRAADMLATSRRSEVLAATMLGQAKTVFQAEIDAACELIDFMRFNVQFLAESVKYKPLDVADHTVNTMELRGMEGFVAAIAPFNFTAIAGNLCTAPALMGNVVLFKPSDTAVLASYVVYKVLRECGLPPGVINFVPSDGPAFGRAVTRSPHLAGVNFTGSVPTFKWLWKNVAANLDTYRTYPRLSGECGGKNFHLVHESADVESASVATVRSAFEYSGQKCSACSRLYVPESKWAEMRERLVALVAELKVNTPLDHDTFTSAVIDDAAFNRIRNYVDYAKSNAADYKLIFGGGTDNSVGYYVQPTLFETSEARGKLMTEEIFGPVLTAYVYKDADYERVLDLVDSSTPYALTGSIFCRDERVLANTRSRLRQACGNMYINDKSTGAVVNQQPFGGGRLSGTNDKPGGPHYLLKWASPLSVKEYRLPQTSVKHASML